MYSGFVNFDCVRIVSWYLEGRAESVILFRLEELAEWLWIQVNASCKFRAKCLEQFAESLSVRSSAYVFDQVLECSVESLHVRPSPWVFGRVSGWPAYSFPGSNSHQCEAVSVFNHWDSNVPLPPGWLQRSGCHVQLSVYTMQLLISNDFALLLISVVLDMSKIFLNHIRKIRPPSGFTW
jgi:hypothetical protein